ncbi:MAG: prepilin peptidase [bacterium]
MNIPNILYGIFVFCFGLTFGSLANVCIYRIPREESVVFPGSHCPKCEKPIRWYDNIPLVGFIALGGKCRYCKNRISLQYPLVELVTALFFLALFLRFGFTVTFFVTLVLVYTLIIISGIDFKTQLIPDVLSIPLLGAGLLVSFINPILDVPSYKLFMWTRISMPSSLLHLLSAILGVLVGGGLLYFIAWVSKGGMGGGDIKLAGAIGAFFGWENVLWSLGVAFFVGGILAVILLTTGIKGRKDPIPFGPFIALGAIVVMFFRTFLYNLLFYSTIVF